MQDHTIESSSSEFESVLTKGSDTKWNILIERRVKSENRVLADGTIVPENHFAFKQSLHDVREIFHLRSSNFGHPIRSE